LSLLLICNKAKYYKAIGWNNLKTKRSQMVYALVF
jgi:hypothetical protein